MKNWASWGMVLSCGLLTACGVHGGLQSEQLAKREARLGGSVQVSADFPLDQEVAPEFNPNATLLSIAASTAAGYLLAYNLPYAPDVWSRPYNAYVSTQLVLMHLDAAGGAPTSLAQVPAPTASAQFHNARLLDVGSGWLLVYEVGTTTLTRYAMTVARDGSLGTPVAVPGACSNGLAGFARATDTALLSDACGGGVLLDFSGHVLKTLTLANIDTFAMTSGFCGSATGITGGQLAFNGIDYLALYSCYSTYTKNVLGIPVSPTGDIGATVVVVTQPAVPYKGVLPLSIAGYNGTFMAVVSELQSSGPQAAAAYKTISETAGHVFSVGAEHVLPGESILNDGQLSDHNATALALGSGFAVVREHSNGNLDLVKPGSPTDTVQTLQSSLLSTTALVSSSDPFAAGDSFLIAASAHAVRFNASAQAIDAPPKDLFLAQRGQHMPALAFDGQSYLAAWSEGIITLPGWVYGRTPQVFGHRLSATGALLGAARFQISPATGIGNGPLLAANPGSFSAAWNAYPTTGISGAATVSSTDPPVVTSYAAPPGTSLDFGIATDGAHTSVAWAAGPSSVFIAQLASGGSWSSPVTIATSNADYTTRGPALAFDGAQYAVLWTAAGDPGQRVLYGARVSAALTLLDVTPKELLRFAVPVNGAPVDCFQVVAVADHFVVAWSSVVGNNEEVRLARLSGTLQLLDPGGVLVGTQPASQITSSNEHVALSWDGASVWVVWRDVDGGAHRPIAVLRGRRFSEALVPVDTESFVISSDLDEYSRVTIVHGASDSSMVGYTRYTADAGGSFRVRGRLLSASPFAEGVPCSSASQCQGGACISGACSTATGGGGAGGATGSGGSSGSTPLGDAGDAGDAGSSPIGEAGSGVGGSAGAIATGGASGASQAGASHGGQAGASGSSHAGQAGATAGSGGGGSSGHSCSIRSAGGNSSRDHLPLAGVLLAIGAALYRRRNAN